MWKHESESQLWRLTGYDGAGFFRAFRVSSAFLTKNSQMTSPILGLDTRQAVYDWINGLYRAAAALLAHILCHQSWEHRTRVHRWPGGETRDRHCYQNCVRNTTLWPVLCIQLITHFTPQLTILGQIRQTCKRGADGKIKIAPLYSPQPQHLRW